MNPEQDHNPDPTTVATQLVDELVTALVNVRIYAATHPRVKHSIEGTRNLAQQLAAISGEDPVHIGCTDDLMIFRSKPMLAASLSAARLIGVLRQWGSGGLSFRAQVTAEDIGAVLTAITERPAAGENHATVNARLEQRRVTNVLLLPPYVDGDAKGNAAPATSRPVRMAVHLYQNIVDMLQNVTIKVCSGGRIQFDPVQSLAEQMLLRLDSSDGPLLGLARQDQYDAFTFGHSVRVAVLAMVFAKQLTDDRDLVVRIGVAALLHDVGKALIPFEILHSKRRLTPEEFDVMRKHPQYGAELLLDHHDSDPLAIVAAFGHHHTGDSRGYPMTLHEHQSSMVTEIVKICDVYEALTAARPYKRPMSPVKAYRVMMTMAGKFDPMLLRRFIEVNGVFPVGQPVQLDTGELAVVRRQGSDVKTPIVEVVTDPHGGDLAEADRQILDLADIECCAARSIIGEAAPDAAERVLHAVVTSR